MGQVIFSAKFKRDYVAYLAVVIFFAIVIAEIVLAVSIPWYLKREDSLAFEVRKLKMLESFDGVRNLAAKINTNDELAQLELKLVNHNLNHLAIFLRAYGKNISPEEVDSVNATISGLQPVLYEINKGKHYAVDRQLDFTTFYKKLTEETLYVGKDN